MARLGRSFPATPFQFGVIETAAQNDIGATGSVSITGAAILNAAGALAAAGSLSLSGVADLDALGNLAAAGSIAISGVADLTGAIASDLTAAGSLSIQGAASLTAIGQLIAAGTIRVTGVAELGTQSAPDDGFFEAWADRRHRREAHKPQPLPAIRAQSEPELAVILLWMM